MKVFKILLTIYFVMSTLVWAMSAFADQIYPVSYDMINGRSTDGPVYSLRDDTYSGGTGDPHTNYSNLAGGKGDLTDGILAIGYWWQSQTAANPYIGWKDDIVPDPTITFHFSNPIIFTQVSVGMVQQYRPGSVDITIGNNPIQNFNSFDDWGPAGWEWVDFVINNLVGDTLVLRLNDNTYAWNTDWIMIDEVKFQGTSQPAVPVPAAAWLLGTGLLGLLGLRRWTRTQS